MIVLGYHGALLGYPERVGAGHDSAAAIVVDGEVVAACEEERFNREKHSPKFPKQAIAFCLKQAGLKSLEQVDLVVYPWSCGLMFGQDMLNQNAGNMNVLEKLGTWVVLRFMQNFNKLISYDNRNIQAIFERHTGVKMAEGKWRAIPHHNCHVASTFYDSPYDESLVVTLDGSGERTSSMVALAKGTDIKTLHEVLVPNSLGFLYLFITNFLGFQPNSDEYKVMGLAPYGDRSRYRDFFRSFVKKHDDGRYEVDQGVMVQLLATLGKHGALFFPPALTSALGPARKEHEPVEQRHMDIAASLQECLEETVLHSLEKLQKQTGQQNLCMAGGVTLNCTMNGLIARSGIFKNVWIPTAPHDAGTSVGAALWGYHNTLHQPRHFQKARHRYLGPSWQDSDVDAALVEFGQKVTHTRPQDLNATVAQALSEGKVVGWYQGSMEWGPRALGNRSILADPRRDDMKDVVNHAVKLREGFRPFAPACLAEKANEWFDLTGLPDSPYMLFVIPVQQDKRTRIPAVTHVDGSARVQTVRPEDNPRFHALLTAFEKLTGVPVLMNTSFNIKGEPIVNTPADAVRCFLGTQIDLLVLHDVVVEKRPEIAARLLAERGRHSGAGRVVDGRIEAT